MPLTAAAGAGWPFLASLAFGAGSLAAASSFRFSALAVSFAASLADLASSFLLLDDRCSSLCLSSLFSPCLLSSLLFSAALFSSTFFSSALFSIAFLLDVSRLLCLLSSLRASFYNNPEEIKSPTKTSYYLHCCHAERTLAAMPADSSSTSDALRLLPTLVIGGEASST